jgi:hypothetical protein
MNDDSSIPRRTRRRTPFIDDHAPIPGEPAPRAPMRFISPDEAAKLTGGRQTGGNQWVGRCPCCDDQGMSLSIRWGRKSGTVVKCHNRDGCEQRRLVAWFRHQGFRLDPVLPSVKPKHSRRRHRGLMVEDSFAFRALTLSERRMYDLIKGSQSPTYNAFVAAGVRREAIPQGLRAMEALGLIGVERKPFNARTHRYDMNAYRLAERWVDFQPRQTPPKMRARAGSEALARAKAVAQAARRKPQAMRANDDLEAASEGPPTLQ